MLALANRPLPLRTALFAASALIACMGIYCLAYNATQGRPETVWNAFSWPVINLLPFFAAFEAGKRSNGWRDRTVALTAGLLSSLVLELLAAGQIEVTFEMVRRLPAMLAVCALLALGDLPAKSARQPVDPAALSLLPHEIDWISASGNYVVLHGLGRRVVHRAALSKVEHALARHGFIRIHRSRLVRRSAVARVRPVDVVLHDGTSVPTGARFRATLDSLAA